MNSGNIIPIGMVGDIYFVVEYEVDAARVDGPFTVSFGDIKCIIKSTND